jgi:cyclophilin family peptidyl-prolyl cis-trans isomerase
MKLAKLGAYNSVHFFRVDKGFVAQTADVVYGRLEGVGLDSRQKAGCPVMLHPTRLLLL